MAEINGYHRITGFGTIGIDSRYVLPLKTRHFRQIVVVLHVGIWRKLTNIVVNSVLRRLALILAVPIRLNSQNRQHLPGSLSGLLGGIRRELMAIVGDRH